MVAAALPGTLEELRDVFTGMESPLQGASEIAGIERRSPIPRRDATDRREFPPRPEGRRMGGGRRKTDAA